MLKIPKLLKKKKEEKHNMEISGKVTLFVAKREIEVEGKKKLVVDLSTTISSKAEDGNYINKRVKVKLVGKQFSEEALLKLDENKCYTMEVLSGFIGVDSFKSKGQERRELVFVITEAKLKDSKEVVRKVEIKDDNLPF